jgi:hypothetical protein
LGSGWLDLPAQVGRPGKGETGVHGGDLVFAGLVCRRGWVIGQAWTLTHPEGKQMSLHRNSRHSATVLVGVWTTVLVG